MQMTAPSPNLPVALAPLCCVPGVGGDSVSPGQLGLERPSSVPAQAQEGSRGCNIRG